MTADLSGEQSSAAERFLKGPGTLFDRGWLLALRRLFAVGPECRLRSLRN